MWCPGFLVEVEGLKDAFLLCTRIGEGADAKDFGEPADHVVPVDENLRLNLRERREECCVAMLLNVLKSGDSLYQDHIRERVISVFPNQKVTKEDMVRHLVEDGVNVERTQALASTVNCHQYVSHDTYP